MGLDSSQERTSSSTTSSGLAKMRLDGIQLAANLFVASSRTNEELQQDSKSKICSLSLAL